MKQQLQLFNNLISELILCCILKHQWSSTKCVAGLGCECRENMANECISITLLSSSVLCHFHRPSTPEADMLEHLQDFSTVLLTEAEISEFEVNFTCKMCFSPASKTLALKDVRQETLEYITVMCHTFYWRPEANNLAGLMPKRIVSTISASL